MTLPTPSGMLSLLALAAHVDEELEAAAVVATWESRLPASVLQLHELQAPPTPDNPFVFYHLRKSGGSQLRSALSAAASRLGVAPFVACFGNVPCETYAPPIQRQAAGQYGAWSRRRVWSRWRVVAVVSGRGGAWLRCLRGCGGAWLRWCVAVVRSSHSPQPLARHRSHSRRSFQQGSSLALALADKCEDWRWQPAPFGLSRHAATHHRAGRILLELSLRRGAACAPDYYLITI